MSWLWAVTHVAIYTTLGSLRVASQEPDIYQTRRYQSVVLIHDSLSMVALSISTALYPIFYMLPDPHGSTSSCCGIGFGVRRLLAFPTCSSVVFSVLAYYPTCTVHSVSASGGTWVRPPNIPSSR